MFLQKHLPTKGLFAFTCLAISVSECSRLSCFNSVSSSSIDVSYFSARALTSDINVVFILTSLFDNRFIVWFVPVTYCFRILQSYRPRVVLLDGFCFSIWCLQLYISFLASWIFTVFCVFAIFHSSFQLSSGRGTSWIKMLLTLSVIVFIGHLLHLVLLSQCSHTTSNASRVFTVLCSSCGFMSGINIIGLLLFYVIYEDFSSPSLQFFQ